MLTCCNTARGRLACGLGGVLIAALALACLWAFSPSVTAGDDPLPKIGEKTSRVPDLPRAPAADKNKSDIDLPPCPPMPPAPPAPPPVAKPPKADITAPPPPLPPDASAPAPPPLPPKSDVAPPPAPLPQDDKAPPFADVPMPTGPAKSAQFAPEPPPPSRKDPLVTPVAGVSTPPPATPPKPPVDAQDIKQLVTQLSEIRADRTKLDEKERQTIQTIKKKYQDQKHALEQLERELKQLGINCDEAGPEEKTEAAPKSSRTGRPTRY